MQLGEHATRTLADPPFLAIRRIAYESGSWVAGAPTARGSDAAKLCLLPDVQRAFSEAHRQNSTNICLSSVVIFLTRKIQPRYGGSKASIDRQFAARLPDKWIGSALGSDFCRRAVAGKNRDVVPERE